MGMISFTSSLGNGHSLRQFTFLEIRVKMYIINNNGNATVLNKNLIVTNHDLNNHLLCLWLQK